MSPLPQKLPRSVLTIRAHEVDVTDAKRLGQFIEGNDGGVALTPLEVAEVLLAEA